MVFQDEQSRAQLLLECMTYGRDDKCMRRTVTLRRELLVLTTAVTITCSANSSDVRNRCLLCFHLGIMCHIRQQVQPVIPHPPPFVPIRCRPRKGLNVGCDSASLLFNVFTFFSGVNQGTCFVTTLTLFPRAHGYTHLCTPPPAHRRSRPADTPDSEGPHGPTEDCDVIWGSTRKSNEYMYTQILFRYRVHAYLRLLFNADYFILRQERQLPDGNPRYEAGATVPLIWCSTACPSVGHSLGGVAVVSTTVASVFMIQYAE
ncbi:unnamed protein product [Soboliphyme baturini]|uniref:Uncharacterized protein n=1 Tax=Soboliphyme baturini TaxID=241478 RepID=A0A183IGQ2_9BILA|nr:unnamed protein product [Soboliphyme baturini]